MSWSEEESMDFFEAFSFEPRIPCPFCQKLMKVYRTNHATMFTEHTASHSCENNDCKLPPSTRYSVTYNESKDKFVSSVIVPQIDGIYYQLFSNEEQGETWLEKLVPNGAGTFWVPKSIIEIEKYIKFDPNSPIESGSDIVKRLLGLKLFY